MTAHRIPLSLTLPQRLIAGACSFAFGAVLLYGSGFAQGDGLHNAAHDTRHAIGFPCH